MDVLDRHERERYMVLRSLRIAHALLDQLERQGAPRPRALQVTATPVRRRARPEAADPAPPPPEEAPEAPEPPRPARRSPRRSPRRASGEPLQELLGLMRHFVMDHFFTREEALLEAWARRQRAQRLAEVELLRQQHALGRAILQQVAEAAQRSSEPARVRVDLGKLITQVSESLMRGQDAVHRVEIRVRGAGAQQLAEELAGALQGPEAEEHEDRFLRMIEELERMCPGSTGDGGPADPGDEGTGI